MSRILRRPMFRGGPISSYNTGIASGLGEEGYADGGRVSAKVGGFFSGVPPFLRPISGAPVGGSIPKMPFKDIIGAGDLFKTAQPYLAKSPLGTATGLGLLGVEVGKIPGRITDSGYEIEGGEEEKFIKDAGTEILGKETSTGEAITDYYLEKNKRRLEDLKKRNAPGDKEMAAKLEKIITAAEPKKETTKSELDKLKEFYEKQFKDEREKYKLKLEGLQTPKLTEEEEITKQTELYQKLLGGEEAKSQAAYDALLAAAPAFFKGRNLREAAPQVLESINKSGAFDKPKDIRQAAAQLAIQRRILLDKAATEENQRLALARIAAESRQKDIFDVLKEGNIPLGSFLGSYEAANREGGPGVLINKYYLTKDNVLVRIDKGKDGQPLPTALAKI
jgi:hypothetical protein